MFDNTFGLILKIGRTPANAMKIQMRLTGHRRRFSLINFCIILIAKNMTYTLVLQLNIFLLHNYYFILNKRKNILKIQN